MNRSISSLINSIKRAAIAISLIAFFFLMSGVLVYGSLFEAQAGILTPEGTAYEVERAATEHPQEQDGLPNKQLMEKSRQNLKNNTDNVREKLNLDQPIAPETKDFFNDVQEKIQDVVQGVQQSFQRTSENMPGSKER